ncbi:MAG: hypothetical protein NXH88_07195 [Hyphomonas sp.]|nr:hypothetical protein [Hyphomonas sp.]
MTMLTDQRLEEFIFIKEGGNRIAYDDFQPWKKLQPGDEVKGTLTYGPGFIKRPDGSPVQIGDSMTDQEAYDRLRKYIAEEVEPVLEDLIHVPIATSLANALGSLVYNFGATEVYGWRLWGRINSGEPVSAIISEWIDGTFSSKGVPMLGLWRRRFSELALAMNVDWRAGDNVDWETDPEEFLQVLGWDGTMPKPDLIKPDPEIFEPEQGAPVNEPITDPTPETPLTTSDLNAMSLESAKTGRPIDYGVPMTKLTKAIPVESVHYLNAEDKQAGNITVKPIEESRRGKGYAKAEMGKQGMIAGAGGSAAVAIGAAEPVVKFVDKYPANTIALVFLFLLIIGIGLHYYGRWEREQGEDGAEDLLG